MYSTVTLLVFFAFLLLFNLSKKTDWNNKPRWAKKIENNKSLSRGLSFAIMCFSVLALILAAGTGAGIFNFLLILMTVGSLVVLITPFRYLAAKHVVGLYVLCLIFELLIFTYAS
ncbi:MAG: hypothetical protein ABWY16_00635 [Pedobacter sp.]|uniref:hypothetical protein n=1 Tax=Pedobacter sp. TaxID=1411316 RepID=UPI0033912937